MGYKSYCDCCRSACGFSVNCGGIGSPHELSGGAKMVINRIFPLMRPFFSNGKRVLITMLSGADCTTIWY